MLPENIVLNRKDQPSGYWFAYSFLGAEAAPLDSKKARGNSRGEEAGSGRWGFNRNSDINPVEAEGIGQKNITSVNQSSSQMNCIRCFEAIFSTKRRRLVKVLGTQRDIIRKRAAKKCFISCTQLPVSFTNRMNQALHAGKIGKNDSVRYGIGAQQVFSNLLSPTEITFNQINNDTAVCINRSHI
jgi:hypothetical protein